MTDEETILDPAGSHAARGFLCSESVLLAIAEMLKIKDGLIPRIATGFGAGIGGCGEVCGAVSGAVMGLGLNFGRDEVRERSVSPYWFGRELVEKFEQEFGHVTCRELTGCDLRTEDGRREYEEANLWETKCRCFIRGASAIAFNIISERSGSMNGAS